MIFQLTVLGTPAEENEGGKMDFIRNNVFTDNAIDVAMMSHPFPHNSLERNGFLANQQQV